MPTLLDRKLASSFGKWAFHELSKKWSWTVIHPKYFPRLCRVLVGLESDHIDPVLAASHHQHPKINFCTVTYQTLFCKQWIYMMKGTLGSSAKFHEVFSPSFRLEQNRTHLFMSLKIVAIICLVLPQGRGPLRYATCNSLCTSFWELQSVFEMNIRWVAAF